LCEERGLYSSTTGDGGVVVQRLPDGEPSAFAKAEDGDYMIEFPGLAVFAFRSGSPTIRVDAPRSTPTETVARLFRTVAVPFALQTAGYEALHASAVLTSAGVVAFCGQSGSGKSTLAYALARRSGFRLWADDALVLGPPMSPERPYVCLNVPQEPNLRPESKRFFGARVSSADSGPAEQGEERLGLIVLLEPAAAEAAPELVKLSVVDALTGILPHAYCFFVDEGREDQTVRALVDLAGRVPVLRLRFPAGFDLLEPTLDLVEARVAALPAVA
jgi:hypothetical protein